MFLFLVNDYIIYHFAEKIARIEKLCCIKPKSFCAGKETTVKRQSVANTLSRY
jgi:hypothetical protein